MNQNEIETTADASPPLKRIVSLPSNWTDNDLTGNDVPELPWNCPEIEAYTNRLRKRNEPVDMLIDRMVSALREADEIIQTKTGTRSYAVERAIEEYDKMRG